MLIPYLYIMSGLGGGENRGGCGKFPFLHNPILFNIDGSFLHIPSARCQPLFACSSFSFQETREYSHKNIFKTVFYLYSTLQNQTNQINPKHLPHSLKSCSHCALLPLRTHFSETQSESVQKLPVQVSLKLTSVTSNGSSWSPVPHISG